MISFTLLCVIIKTPVASELQRTVSLLMWSFSLKSNSWHSWVTGTGKKKMNVCHWMTLLLKYPDIYTKNDVTMTSSSRDLPLFSLYFVSPRRNENSPSLSLSLSLSLPPGRFNSCIDCNIGNKVPGTKYTVISGTCNMSFKCVKFQWNVISYLLFSEGFTPLSFL